MSIRRLNSGEEPQNVVRRPGRHRRRNGLANVLSSLSGEEIQALRAQADSQEVQPHPARRGSTGTVSITSEQLQNLSLQRRRSIGGESRHAEGGEDPGQDSLGVPAAGLIRISPSSSLRLLEEQVEIGGQNGGDQSLHDTHIPTSNYLRRRRNAISYVNSTQFFLESLLGKASK